VRDAWGAPDTADPAGKRSRNSPERLGGVCCSPGRRERIEPVLRLAEVRSRPMLLQTRRGGLNAHECLRTRRPSRPQENARQKRARGLPRRSTPGSTRCADTTAASLVATGAIHENAKQTPGYRSGFCSASGLESADSEAPSTVGRRFAALNWCQMPSAPTAVARRSDAQRCARGAPGLARAAVIQPILGRHPVAVIIRPMPPQANGWLSCSPPSFLPSPRL
jgi:hypothetical protein